MRRGWWRQALNFAEAVVSGEAPGKKPDGRALHIALEAGDLAGKAQRGLSLQAQRVIEQSRRLMKVLRCSPPSRANSAFSSPGIMRKMRVCSAYFSLV